MKKYKLKKSAAQIKTYVAVITYGTCSTIVTIDDGELETEVVRSMGANTDGVTSFNYNGDIPLSVVAKNNELADHYINYYIKVSVGHLPDHLKKKVKENLLQNGVEIGLQGGADGTIKFSLQEEDFDAETNTDILSIVKSIQFV